MVSSFDKCYCPFIKDVCREDCVFSCRYTVTSQCTTTCLLVSKIDSINGRQYEQLANILYGISEETATGTD